MWTGGGNFEDLLNPTDASSSREAGPRDTTQQFHMDFVGSATGLARQGGGPSF